MKKQGWKYWRGVVIAYGFMLLLLLLFASCKTHKNTVDIVDKGSQIEVEKVSGKDSVINSTDFKLEFDTASFVKTWDVTIYDTEKEDHPIKAVIHGTTQAKTSHKEISHSEEVEEVIVSDSLNVIARDTVFTKSETEKVVNSSVASDFFGFGFFLLFLVVFIFVVKYVVKTVL